MSSTPTAEETRPAPEEPGPSLAEQAYRALRDQLIMLDIAPGEPLNEGRLAAQLAVGRTPLREALKRLELDRLVVSFPRRGTFATRVDITDLAAVTEMRELLEPLAASAAAARLSQADRAALQRADEEIRALADGADRRAVMAADLAVHRRIYRAAANRHLEDSLLRLDNIATRIWCVVVDRLPDAVEHVREHGALLEAILDGEAEQAARLAREHVRHFDAAIRRVL